MGRLLHPGSVAVVGATDRPGSYAAHVLLNLAAAGFAGPVHGVHPRRSEVLGVPVVPTLADLPGPVDAVVIATPAGSVAGYLAEAARLGCGGAVVFATGFAEAGSASAQAVLREAAGGIPVLGPNGNGLVAVVARAPLWGDPVRLPDAPGGIAVVTQSGNLGVTALAHRGGLGLHTVLSLGNAAVVDAAAAIRALAAEQGVRALALYLEDDGDGARLAAAFAACAERAVRLCVLKAGRSAAGRVAGASHTAALAGDQRVFAALVEEAGGVMVEEPLQLLETARALASARRDRRGVAILTCSGGDSALAADLAADAGVPLPAVGDGNPFDHTNALWADSAAVADVAGRMASDPRVGHLLYVQDEPPGLGAADAAEWAATRDGALAGACTAGKPALLVAGVPGQEPPGAVAGLRSALAALAALRRPAPDPARLRAIATSGGHIASSGAAIAGAASSGHFGRDTPASRDRTARWTGVMAEHDANRLLAAAGVPVPAARVATTADQAVGAARVLGLPVAVKASAPGLLHASDAGLVALDLGDDEAVRGAAARVLAAGPPGAVVLVERMVPAEVELIVAVRTDAVLPCLLLGLGGIWAEVFDDVVTLLLPVEGDAVLAGLRRLRAAPLLFGSRGRPALAVEALASLAVSAAGASVQHHLGLLELNPVRLGRDAAVAVDAVLRLDGPADGGLPFLNGQSGLA